MHSHTWSTTLLCTGSLVGLMFVASLPRHLPSPSMAAAPAVTATTANDEDASAKTASTAKTSPELTVLPKPQVVVAGDNPQTLVIRGRNLTKGLTAKLDGTFESIAFGEHSIVDVTPTSFGLRAAFTQEGTYRLTVRTVDGSRSNPVTIVVTARSAKHGE